MESGGKVIDFAKYAKSKDLKIKGISLASLFTPGKALSECVKYSITLSHLSFATLAIHRQYTD